MQQSPHNLHWYTRSPSMRGRWLLFACQVKWCSHPITNHTRCILTSLTAMASTVSIALNSQLLCTWLYFEYLVVCILISKWCHTSDYLTDLNKCALTQLENVCWTGLKSTPWPALAHSLTAAVLVITLLKMNRTDWVLLIFSYSFQIFWQDCCVHHQMASDKQYCNKKATSSHVSFCNNQ